MLPQLWGNDLQISFSACQEQRAMLDFFKSALFQVLLGDPECSGAPEKVPAGDPAALRDPGKWVVCVPSQFPTCELCHQGQII